MAAGDDAKDALARNAEPLRQALRGYFRRRIPDAAEIDDLVQEVFARIVARDSSQPVERLGGYVFQTAASVLADRARRRSVRQADRHIPLDPLTHAEPDFDPERILSARQDLRAVTAALLSMPERTRTIFVLYRMDGLQYAEIAARLGISISAVQKHVLRAMQRLMDEVDRLP